MRILVLINAAPQHRPFYGAVGTLLSERGHEVHYALDSHYSDVLHAEEDPLPNAHYFSDYLRANRERRTLPVELQGANLSLMMFSDVERFLFTRGQPTREPEWFHSVAANLAHFFVELFESHRFDSIVYENVSNAFIHVACEVALRRGARFVGFLPSRLPGRTDVLDRVWSRNSQTQKVFEEFLSGGREIDSETREFVSEYIENFEGKEPDYMTGHSFEAPLLKRYFSSALPLKRMLRSMKYRLIHGDDARYAFQQANPYIGFPEQFAREALRQTKAYVLARSLYRADVELNVPYFVYALQFHPESSTSVDSPAFLDEWHNIEGVSQNMPFGYTLYVKDHRHAAGRQSLEFYAKVAKLPNVQLVSPYYPPKKLMRKARAVVCTTSTMGFEALVLGRPVFVLGHPFYDFFPLCKRVISFDGAHALFVRHDEFSATPFEIECLVAAYFTTSEPGVLDLTRMFDDASKIQWIADIVERKTKEHLATRNEHD